MNQNVFTGDEDELDQQHKKERKELQCKVQALKKTAIKGDKKKKKEVQEEIAKLEMELSQKHDNELSALKTRFRPQKQLEEEEDLVESLEDTSVSSSNTSRVSKAQKRRDKKAAEQRERDKRITEQEIENESGLRNVETQKIKEILKKKGLMLYEVAPDGDCLYNAVDHQLKLHKNMMKGTKALRNETSQNMRINKNDYLPFLTNTDTGDTMTEEEFEEYCVKVAETTQWGGQLELRALSHILKLPITVVQGDGPCLVMGEEYLGDDELVLSYHRHMYGLGEHYNSVQPYVEDESS